MKARRGKKRFCWRCCRYVCSGPRLPVAVAGLLIFIVGAVVAPPGRDDGVLASPAPGLHRDALDKEPASQFDAGAGVQLAMADPRPQPSRQWGVEAPELGGLVRIARDDITSEPTRPPLPDASPLTRFNTLGEPPPTPGWGFDSPTPDLSFEGLGATAGDPHYPDTQIAVGEGIGYNGRVVQVTQSRVGMWRKTGPTDGFFILRLDEIFEPSPGNKVGSAKVVYDQHAGRFWIVCLENADPPDPAESKIHIAASIDSTPENLITDWEQWEQPAAYAFDTVLSCPKSIQGIGADEHALFIAMNYFGGGTDPFKGARILVREKAPPGEPGNMMFLTLPWPEYLGLRIYDMMPAHVYGPQPDPAAFFLINRVDHTRFHLMAITGHDRWPNLQLASGTFAWSAAEQRERPHIANQCNDLDGGLEACPYSITSAVYRDGRIYCSQTSYEVGRPTEVLWHEIRPSLTVSPHYPYQPTLDDAVVQQTGGIMDPDVSFHNASIAVDDLRNAALCFTESSPTGCPSVSYALRLGGDDPGVFRSRQVAKTSAHEFNVGATNGSQPWGSTSGAVPDPGPLDGVNRCFWVANEYSKSDYPSLWGTWIAKFCTHTEWACCLRHDTCTDTTEEECKPHLFPDYDRVEFQPGKRCPSGHDIRTNRHDSADAVVTHWADPALYCYDLAPDPGPKRRMPGSSWSDNFDSYGLDTQVEGQGGWENWSGDWYADAYVRDVQANSGPHSVDISMDDDPVDPQWDSNVVRPYNGYGSGVWVYEAWCYVPDDFESGPGEPEEKGSHFGLLNTYDPGSGDYRWSVQLRVDSPGGGLGGWFRHDGLTPTAVPLIYGQWVQVYVYIDLSTDSYRVHYNGIPLGSGVWSRGIDGGGGALEIAAVNLRANGSTPVYWDDLQLYRPPVVSPPVWYESFDTYDLLSELEGQGLWENWQDDPFADAFVTDAEALSPPHSVDISTDDSLYPQWDSNVVHTYSMYTSGLWEYKAYLYVPGDFESGGVPGERGAHFGLLNTYDVEAQDYRWSVRLRADSDDGGWFRRDGIDGGSLPLITDRWVEVKVRIDLDRDLYRVYYNGVPLGADGYWTEGIDGKWDGALNIAAVNLRANGSSTVYVDDLHLREPPYVVDGWRTHPDETEQDTCHNFGGDAASSPEIPADFFTYDDINGPHSEPFAGQACLEGVPDVEWAYADTLVRRWADPFHPRDLSPKPRTVEAEIFALRLRSIEDIAVNYDDGSTEYFAVEVMLSPTQKPPNLGTVTATRTHCNGGTYDSVLYVCPLFKFIGVRGTLDLDACGSGWDPVTLLQTGNTWVADAHPSLNFNPASSTCFHPGIVDDPIRYPPDCDCDENGIRDDWELTGNDCNGNGVHDACEPDSDGDDWIDGWDNCPHDANPMQEDFDGDLRGDLCDPCPYLPGAIEGDEDGDLIDDILYPASAADNCPCVPNHDQLDTDNDGIGDACDCFPRPGPPLAEATVPDIGSGTRNRYLSFGGVTPAAEPQAARVTFKSLPADPPHFDFRYAEGRQMWVGEPRLVSESSGNADPTPPPTFWATELQCDPFFTDWSVYDSIHVYDGSIVPGAVYDLQLVAQAWDWLEGCFSEPLEVAMSAVGDVVGDCGVTPCSPPQGVVDFTDISAVVEKFKNEPAAPRKARADLINSEITQPLPDRKVDFVDISYCVDAFRGQASPLPGPPITDPCSPAAKAHAGLRDENALVSLADQPVVISLGPSAWKIHAGSTFDVDVYATGIIDLRAYQLSLVASGGESGMLTVQDLWIDEDRTDYMFEFLDAVAATDIIGKRLGATAMSGGRTTSDRVYLGTFMLRASPDARGDFTLSLRVDEGSTFLRDSLLASVPFRLEEPEPITIEVEDIRSRSQRPIEDSR